MKKEAMLSVTVLSAFLAASAVAHAATAQAPASRPGGPVAPRGGCGGPQRTAGGLFVPRGLDAEVVTISMTDGYKLAADFIRRLKPTTTTPGLIFVHDAGANRRAWNPMMVQMAGRGYSVLSVDLRGHGENPSMQGNPPASCSDMTDAQWAGMLEDFHNVVSFMAMRHDVEAGQIAVVGYGLGATLALKAAAEPWGEAIRCVIAINPRVEDRGIRLDAGLKAIGRKRDVYIACPPAGTTAWAEAKAVAELLPAVKEFAEVPGTPPAPNSLNMGLYRSIPAWLIQSIPPVSNRPGRGGAVAPGAKGR